MALVTLVSSNLAREGYEFIYTGPTPECKTCKIKNACMSLEPGQRYRIARTRDISHDCKLHENVVVVEVDKVPSRTAVESRHASENTIITLEERRCRNIGCEHHPFCSHAFFIPGKYRVIEVGEGLRCHRGMDLKAVLVERA